MSLFDPLAFSAPRTLAPTPYICAIPGSDITDNRFVHCTASQLRRAVDLKFHHHPFSTIGKRASLAHIPETNRFFSPKYHSLCILWLLLVLGRGWFIMTDFHLSCRLAFSKETAARNIPSSPGQVAFGYRPARKSEKRQGLKDIIPIPSRSEISDNRQVDPCQLWWAH